MTLKRLTSILFILAVLTALSIVGVMAVLADDEVSEEGNAAPRLACHTPGTPSLNMSPSGDLRFYASWTSVSVPDHYISYSFR